MAPEAQCPQSGDRFTAYVRGELRSDEAELLEMHVVGCSQCAARLTEEASFEAALYDFGETIEQELNRAPRWLGIRRWWTQHRPRLGPMPAWGSLALASALAFVVCDRAALHGLVDGTSPAPGTLAARSDGAAPIDDDMPRCEEPIWPGALVGDGPTCLEPLALASVSLASFEASDSRSPDRWASYPLDDADGTDALEGEAVCQPDDGGELVCSPDAPLDG